MSTEEDREPIPEEEGAISGSASSHTAITVADTASRESCERLFLEALPVIQRVVAIIAAQRRLSSEEAEEFASVVQLRIIKDDYDVFRKFRGRCSLSTFLFVVIRRMWLDYRIMQWGKWRPSAQSRRAGNAGIMLERLTIRDGLTFEEACAVLEATHESEVDRGALRDLYRRLRPRTRPRFVEESALDHLMSPADSAEDLLIGRENGTAVANAGRELADVLAMLSADDRTLIELRFEQGLTVSDIARVRGMDQKALYRRIDRLLRTLRQLLESRDISGAEVLAALAHRSGDCRRRAPLVARPLSAAAEGVMARKDKDRSVAPVG